MEATIKDGKLHLVIEVLNPPKRSASGKSLVVATTSGNLTTNVMVDGKPLVIGLNAYIKA